jgi:hypothetical protein
VTIVIDATSAMLLAGFAGAVTGLARRLKTVKRGYGIIAITANDYGFRKFATIPLLTFVYAAYQGGALGVAIALILLKLNGFISDLSNTSMLCPGEWNGKCNTGSEYIWISASVLASVILARLIVESYIILFRVAQIYIDNHAGGGDEDKV